MKGPALARLILLILFVIGTTLAEQAPGSAEQKPLKMGQSAANIFVGIISDSFCGPRHKLPDKSAEECTRFCQRKGASYVLVAGPKIYQLSGRANDLGYLAGQKAKVTGSLQGDKIVVGSVGPTQ